ncbi:YtxH domain-containing protein [Desertivibrio insolitus]|uniref:YtxH domain-containing protein n=1 Tax=Herbiconiux sp. SYSU D00978 TaxID=2812562 RepID=UPI001A966C3E|nr:YtxH domain-containing protein [Herbiconiux sp. SYSU D00978]
MRKFTFLVGAAVGYLLGSAAGRQQYEKIKSTASGLWEKPQVQRLVDQAKSTIDEKTPESLKSYLKDSTSTESGSDSSGSGSGSSGSGSTGTDTSGSSTGGATGTSATTTGGVTTGSTNPATGTPTPSS